MNKIHLPSFLNRIFRRPFSRHPKPRTEELLDNADPDHALVVSVTSPDRIPRMDQLRYAMQLLSQNERRVLLGAAVLLILSLCTAATLFVQSHTGRQPAVGGTYTEALIGQPKFLNPLDAIANDPDRDLVRLVYSGLFKYEGLETVPDLAESYVWSDEGKTLTVKLRNDIFFHDGEQVSTDDVRFTIESIQDQNRKSPLESQFRNVKLEAQDDKTIIFRLEKADMSFLSKLTVGLMPAHLWQDLPAVSARLSDLNLKPVGSGPYRIKAFTRDSQGSIHSFTLERDDRYYGEKPFIKTVVFQFFVDRRQALDAFKSGLVDAVAFINATDIEKIGASQRLKNISLELPQETVTFFNLKDKTLANKDVRQALSLAVNREDIVDAFNGSAQVVTGPFPFGPIDASTTASNLDQARELLTKAGWAMPQNGNIRIWVGTKKTAAPSSKTKTATAATSTAADTVTANASSTQLTLTILYPDDPDLQNAAEALKRQWSLIGAQVNVESAPLDDVMRRATRERTAQITLLSIFIGPEQDQTPFWWSGGATVRSFNISGIANRDVDDALQAIKNSTTTEAVQAARDKFTATLAEQLPAIFLVKPVQHYLVSNTINGEKDDSTIAAPYERFNDLAHWYIKTGLQWK
ncbi:peptide ABC transporter substrate-binding protein [Candidatus Uhrbacteria bacterium]|nr:peptide ABC transporter substrate-binding protein [Candidatus Uhrbacteria bacterium]